MMIHRIVKVILKAFLSQGQAEGDHRSTEYEQDPDITYFYHYFDSTPDEIITMWIRRSSDFEFMESSVAPEDSKLAVTLLEIVRSTECLYHDLKHRATQRENLNLSPIPLGMTSLASHADDFSLIEHLYDHPSLTCMSRGSPERLRLKMYTQHVLDLIRQKSHEYVDHLITVRLDEVTSGFAPDHSVHLDVIPSQISRLIESSRKDSSADKWLHLFSNSWITPLLSRDQVLQGCLDQLKSSINDLDYDIGSVGKIGSNNQKYAISDELWHHTIFPFCLSEIHRLIKRYRSDDIITDMVQCFESLIDAKRPKDQRIGSFWISEDDPNLITVIFLTRDGRLLAQRDISWDHQHPETIISAFETIHIRTLTYPDYLNQRYPDAISLLSNQYTIKPVISVALSESQAPSNLNHDAYSALRIGQRYVAPLRFWIRADLKELSRHILPPQALKCLEDSDDFKTLLAKLHDHCSERWLDLRRRRAQRQKQTSASNQTSKPDIYARGQRVKVRVIAQVEYYLDVVAIQDGRRGRIRINPTDQRKHPSLSQTTKTIEGLVLIAIVLGEHPTTGDLTLVLDYGTTKPTDHSMNHQSGLGSNEAYSSDSSEASRPQGEETLNRLNSLFSYDATNTNTRHHTQQHNTLSSDGFHQVSVSYRSN